MVSFDPTVGAEIKKTRPAIVISSDAVGRLPIKLVAPLTDWKDYYAANIWHVRIDPDRAVDALHQEVSTIVGMRLTADRRAVFEEVSRLAHDRAGMPSPSARPFRDRATVPYLNEPWYC